MINRIKSIGSNMNPFEKLMKDIFSNKDFLEQCQIGNKTYYCICSSLPDGIVYTEYGQQNIANFTLDIKLPLKDEIKKNTKVIFRGQKYKVDQIQIDSANTSIKIHLVSISKGI